MKFKTVIAIYMRLSQDDGDFDVESNSIINQRLLLCSYVAKHFEDYELLEFQDDGYSGVNFNRPGVQNLLREVKENKVACIVVKDLSRFGRNYIEVGDYIEQIFPFLGVRFVAISDNYDSFLNSGGIEVGFKNLIHDMYSRDLSKKIKSVKRMHQEKGTYIGGDVPYGYMYSGNKKAEKGIGIYQPDLDAAVVVKKIFGLAAEGNTPVNIAKHLNDKGIPTPGAYKNQTRNYNYRVKNTKSNLWVGSKIRDILQNEVYIGTYICHKVTSIRPREMNRNDVSEYLRFENAHEALVSEEVFDAAQKVIKSGEKRGIYKKAENRHALQGKVKCGYCGYAMSRSSNKPDSDYLCRMGDSCGSHLRIKVQILEDAVLEILKKLTFIQRDAELKKEKNRGKVLSELAKGREEKRVLEMKIEHCKTSRLNLYRQWKEQQITKDEYIRKRDEYSKQEEDHKARVQQLDERLDRLIEEQEKKPACDLQGYSGVQSLTKELADKLIETIDVYDENRVEVTWKFRDEYEERMYLLNENEIV